jgi:hypothetical protein
MSLPMPLLEGDYIILGMPAEIERPEQIVKCEELIKCTLSLGQTIKITLTEGLPQNQVKAFTLGNFTNPSNGRPTEAFTLALFDSEGYALAETE